MPSSLTHWIAGLACLGLVAGASVFLWHIPPAPPARFQILVQGMRPADPAPAPAPTAQSAALPEIVAAPTEAYSNRLADESSPYLLMHAHNPVDWYPWGEEAFRKARTENKPIFLSVGYAACHWCLVMERESFSDPKIADIMNRHYVSIKLDREERPDIDRVYLIFLQLTTQGSGYPMSLFLTPDLKPILGGTYFPKTAPAGALSFETFLTEFAGAWENDRANVIHAANSVTESLRGYIRDQVAGKSAPGDSVFRETYQRLRGQYDPANGGFGTRPKYPQPVIFNFLLRYYARTKEPGALDMTAASLRKIAAGGIHDHIGGGFYRYSTDERWQVPHFEKMLYDQALLASSYLDAYQLTRDPWYAGVARRTLSYITGRLRSPGGAFYSAEAADSLLQAGRPETGEGAFYLWDLEEVERVLGSGPAAIFAFHYGIEAGGNVPREQDLQGEMRGFNVLYVRQPAASTAARFGRSESDVEAVLAAAREKLGKARAARPEPARDDKVLASWNGLAISALARAAQVLDDPAYARAAASAAAFVETRLYDAKSGVLKRAFFDGRDGRAKGSAVEGFLEDYAFMIQGLMDLYEASFDVRLLSWARRLQEKQDQLFWDAADNTYFSTSTSDPSVLIRMRDEYDAAEPSANSVAAMNALRLAQLTDDAAKKDRAEKTFAAFSVRLSQSPETLPQLVTAMDFGASKPKQIIIAGKQGAADTRAMLRLVHERFIPNKVVLLADGGAGQAELARALPFIEFMKPRDDKATAYICEDYICRLPTSDLEVMAKLLDGDPLQ